MNGPLITLIDNEINGNGANAITGPVLNNVLKQIVAGTLVPATRLELVGYIAEESLVPGTFYIVTDRGDLGIILQAVSPTKLSRFGSRIMLCPKKSIYTYNPHSPNYGVWRPWKGRYPITGMVGSGFTAGNTLSNGSGTSGVMSSYSVPNVFFSEITGPGFTVGDTLTEFLPDGSPTGVYAVLGDEPLPAGDVFCIWGGGWVWKNVSGYLGKPAPGEEELSLTADWELVPKSNTEVYEPVELNVLYDFESDHIESQWDGSGNKCTFPKALKDYFGFPFNPVDHCDWNQASTDLVITDVVTLFGFRNNCPRENGGMRSYYNIFAGSLTNNDCVNIQNVKCNNDMANSAPDSDAFAAIQNNKCYRITDVYQTGGIKDLPGYIEEYSYHTDDESFYAIYDFDIDAVTGGNTVWVNCLLKAGVLLTELMCNGMGLTYTGSPSITVGIEIDHEAYLPAMTPDQVNDGLARKNDVSSGKTTAPHRRIGITVVGGPGDEVTGGKLKIAGKYL